MLSISAFVKKIKGLVTLRPTLRPLSDDLFLGLIIVLVALGSFGLGRLSKIDGAKTPIQIENAPEVTSETFMSGVTVNGDNGQSASLPDSVQTKTEQLVGSKNGTKYHYAWCSGAQRIAETNRVYFTSKTDAEARGYTPAANCKGL